HWMVHSQLEDSIDTLTRRNAFVKGENRFINHRHQDAIRNKTRRIVTVQRRLSKFVSEPANLFISFIGGSKATDYFDQLHDWNRIHEVQANDFIRPARGRA